MAQNISLKMMFLKKGIWLGDKISKKSFAVVKKAVHLRTGRDLAVKIVDHNLATKEMSLKILLSKMNITGGLKHPNIIAVEKVLLICAKNTTCLQARKNSGSCVANSLYTTGIGYCFYYC